MTTSFQFANPWILLLALIVPALLAAYHLLARRGAKPATMHHPATGLMQGLPRSWRATWRPITTVMRVLAIALMIIGLARPQFVQGRETITGEGVDIALALDISGSMASLDFEPQNRLQASKQVINDFVTERPYDRIGLVIFSNEAFSQSPLTLDHNMVSRSLDQVQLAEESSCVSCPRQHFGHSDVCFGEARVLNRKTGCLDRDVAPVGRPARKIDRHGPNDIARRSTNG